MDFSSSKLGLFNEKCIFVPMFKSDNSLCACLFFYNYLIMVIINLKHSLPKLYDIQKRLKTFYIIKFVLCKYISLKFDFLLNCSISMFCIYSLIIEVIKNFNYIMKRK